MILISQTDDYFIFSSFLGFLTSWFTCLCRHDSLYIRDTVGFNACEVASVLAKQAVLRTMWTLPTIS